MAYSDHEGETLESHVTRKRDETPAWCIFMIVLKSKRKLVAIVTNGLQYCPERCGNSAIWIEELRRILRDWFRFGDEDLCPRRS